MLGKLNLIAVKAKQDKTLKFTALIHHVNEENLMQCYGELKRNRACGIDEVTVEEYGENLQANVRSLVERLKRKTYQPKPVKRGYIPKPGKAEKRGLGIPAVEDKLVQLMLKHILEAIFENNFLDYSYGFRPYRNSHLAIRKLDYEVMKRPVNYIVEVDVRKFFDTVQHDWLIKCLEQRIADRNLLGLIKKLLKSGYVEAGQYHASKMGTPQGGIISPLLANIYLHYVLDLWFDKVVKRQVGGYINLVRYCDDFVVCCQHQSDAENFLSQLEVRLKKFGLLIAWDKTQILPFGRKAWCQSHVARKKMKTFNFLGFTHYCGRSRRGKFLMGHKTTKENLQRKLREIKEWVKERRGKVPLKIWWNLLKVKMSGHYSYFGISGNLRCLDQFYDCVTRLVYKWINKRSQKRSMAWVKFKAYLKQNPLPKPKIYYAFYSTK